MGIFCLSSFLILIAASLGLGQPDVVGGGSEPNLNQAALKTSKTKTKFSSSSSSSRIQPEPPIEVSSCPLPSTISPCTCHFGSFYEFQFFCAGSAVNESSIETTFREIRRVNEIPEDRGIHIGEFRVEFTELSQLDLAPFYGSKIDYFLIYSNDNLTKLVSSGNPRDHGSIHVNRLEVESSPLSRSGFGDALKFFSNGMTSFFAGDLSLSEDDNSNGGEFFSGLSALTNLKYLIFWNCNISGRLTSDTLIPKQLQNLGSIDLRYNSINEVGENAFDFEGREDALNIYLLYNKLNETSFHPNSGIARVDRQTHLYLSSNQLTTLPTPIFETFLDANQRNSLYLDGNPLICDQRLSWLKSRREELESRVRYAYCSNDEGHTVFDSDLIP